MPPPTNLVMTNPEIKGHANNQAPPGPPASVGV